MTYLSQMLALTFQNFVSAAVGMAVLVALFRGFVALEDATSSATSGATSSAGRSTSCSRSRRSWPCCS